MTKLINSLEMEITVEPQKDGTLIISDMNSVNSPRIGLSREQHPDLFWYFVRCLKEATERSYDTSRREMPPTLD